MSPKQRICRAGTAQPLFKCSIKGGIATLLAFSRNSDDLRTPDYRPTCSCRLARPMDVQLHKQARLAVHPLSGTFIPHQRRRFRTATAAEVHGAQNILFIAVPARKIYSFIYRPGAQDTCSFMRRPSAQDTCSLMRRPGAKLHQPGCFL